MLVLGSAFTNILMLTFLAGVVLLCIYAAKYQELYGEQTATCRHCRASVSSKEPWECCCGDRYPVNRDNPTSFFQTECRSCGRKPTTIRCPNCGKGISLHGEAVEANEKWWIRLLKRDYEEPLEPSEVEALKAREEILVHTNAVLDKTIHVKKREAEIDRLNRVMKERNTSIEQKAVDRLRGCVKEKVAVYAELAALIKEIQSQVPNKKDQDRIIESLEEEARTTLGTEYDMVDE